MDGFKETSPLLTGLTLFLPVSLPQSPIADKRLDEWVDAQRIMPLKDSPAPPPPGASQSSSTENDKESSNSPELEASSRQKRKHGKDEVAQLTGPQVRKVTHSYAISALIFDPFFVVNTRLY